MSLVTRHSSLPPHRVVVTGLGCVTPLGLGLPATVAALREARDGITPVTTFDTTGCQSTTAGQIPDADLAAASAISPSSRRQHRASRMVLLALAEALEQNPTFRPDLTVIGTTSGGMSFGEDFYRALRASPTAPSRHRALAHRVRGYLPQQPILDATAPFHFDAPLRILSNACASGTNAIGHAFHVIRFGRARRVLCGGYDALSELVFAGFDALQASTPDRCRPFDRNRTGLSLGEGAAILLLETLDDARAAGRPIFGEITGYGSASDNHHLTQPNPDGSGPRLAMQAALTDAHRPAASIDYINAHGTATPFNDACEARAIQDLCPTAAVSSTKGQTGHTLGAAGAIEAAFCLLALGENFLPANLHFSAPDDGVTLDIVANHIRPTPPTRILSNSLGFGGANASLLLEAFSE